MATKSARKIVTGAPHSTPLRSNPSSAKHPSPHGQPLNYHTNMTFLRGRWLSLGAALQGVIYTVRTQPNAWIELAATAVVAVAGLWFGISALEWAVLGLTVAVILALEAVNTAI